MVNALTFFALILIPLAAVVWIVWGRGRLASHRLEKRLSREAGLWLWAYTKRRRGGGPRFPPPAPEVPREFPRRNEGPRA